jgi:hypothetical protein
LQTNSNLSHKSRHKTPNLLGENPDFFPKCKTTKSEIPLEQKNVAGEVDCLRQKFPQNKNHRGQKINKKCGGRTSPKCQKTSFFDEK